MSSALCQHPQMCPRFLPGLLVSAVCPFRPISYHHNYCPGGWDLDPSLAPPHQGGDQMMCLSLSAGRTPDLFQGHERDCSANLPTAPINTSLTMLTHTRVPPLSSSHEDSPIAFRCERRVLGDVGFRVPVNCTLCTTPSVRGAPCSRLSLKCWAEAAARVAEASQSDAPLRAWERRRGCS